MTLLDAQPYDPAKARRRKIAITATVVVVILLAALAWMNRNWPEEHAVDKFFTAIQNKDYETAYGIYFNDPGWRQHQQKYPQYTYADFYRDWGPGGEWGLVKSYQIYGASNCPGGGSGVVVDLIVNDRAQHAQLYVDKTDKTISTPPCDLEFR
jgi:hypothetical protein